MWYYALISLIVLLISFSLFKKAAGTMSLLKINIVSWIFYFDLFFLGFIGINMILFGVHHYRISKASEAAVFMGYLAFCYVMVMMPLTMVIVQKVCLGGRISAKIKNYFASPLISLQTRKDSSQLLFWGIMSIVAIISTIYVYYIIKKPPFIALLLGYDTEVAKGLRIAAKQDFPGNVYVKNLFCLFLAPFISYIAYCYHRLYRNVSYTFWFYITSFTAICALLYTGEKGPIFAYFLILFFIKCFIEGGSSRKNLIFTSIIILILVSGMYFFVTKNYALSFSSGLGGRLFMGQIGGLPLTFDVFPERLDFLKGASLPWWMVSPFGLEHAKHALIMMKAYNPSGVATRKVGVMNTLFIAEAWANFGWVGFIISPIIVGVIVQFIHNFLVSRKKTPLFLAVHGFFMFSFGITGGFVHFLWNVKWFFLLFLVIFAINFRYVVRAKNRQYL